MQDEGRKTLNSMSHLHLVGFWASSWFLLQHLLNLVMTAFDPVRASKGRGRATVGNLGVQWEVKFWAEKRRRKKMLVPRQPGIRNKHIYIPSCVIIVCWPLSLGAPRGPNLTNCSPSCVGI